MAEWSLQLSITFFNGQSDYILLGATLHIQNNIGQDLYARQIHIVKQTYSGETIKIFYTVDL